MKTIRPENIKGTMLANGLTPTFPTHPGEVLREEIESRGITQALLAREIDMKASLLNELVKGKRSFTVEYALLFEAALGIEADFWIKMQNNYDRFTASHDRTFMEKLSKVKRIAAAL